MNASLTKLRMLSSVNIHVFTFEKSRKRANGKGKDGIKSGDLLNIRRLQEKGKHIGNGNFGASACYANFTFAKNYGYNDDKVEIADAYQAHNDAVNPGSEVGEEALDCEDDKKYDMLSSYVTLDDASVF